MYSLAGCSRHLRLLASVSLCGLTSPLFAQGRPDILWMRGGDISPRSLSLSADGQTVVSGFGSTVKFRRVSDGKLIRTIAFTQLSGGTAGEIDGVALSPDGQYLYVTGRNSSSNNVSYLVRLSDETVIWRADGYLRNPHFSPDSRYIADFTGEFVTRASDGVATIYDQQGTGGVPLWRVFGGWTRLCNCEKWSHRATSLFFSF